MQTMGTSAFGAQVPRWCRRALIQTVKRHCYTLGVDVQVTEDNALLSSLVRFDLVGPLWALNIIHTAVENVNAGRAKHG